MHNSYQALFAYPSEITKESKSIESVRINAKRAFGYVV